MTKVEEHRKAWAAAGHTPEARRKAVATRLKNLKEKKRVAAMAKKGGSITTIDVSSLPKRPEKKKKRGRAKGRTNYTVAQRIRFVERIKADIARGVEVAKACAKVGIHSSQYYIWTKDKRHFLTLPAGKLNGHAKSNGLADADDTAVGITVKVGGVAYEISISEARSIHAGLDALLRAT